MIIEVLNAFLNIIINKTFILFLIRISYLGLGFNSETETLEKDASSWSSSPLRVASSMALVEEKQRPYYGPHSSCGSHQVNKILCTFLTVLPVHLRDSWWTLFQSCVAYKLNFLCSSSCYFSNKTGPDDESGCHDLPGGKGHVCLCTDFREAHPIYGCDMFSPKGNKTLIIQDPLNG